VGTFIIYCCCSAFECNPCSSSPENRSTLEQSPDNCKSCNCCCCSFDCFFQSALDLGSRALSHHYCPGRAQSSYNCSNCNCNRCSGCGSVIDCCCSWDCGHVDCGNCNICGGCDNCGNCGGCNCSCDC
jgi:hypothetical protein